MKKILHSFVPALITFGPIFMVISATPTSGHSVIAGYAGSVGLAIGLASMFGILMRQQREILRLGQLLAGEKREHE